MTPAPDRVVVRAPGKINLSLRVGAVDARGYHSLATVFQAVDLYETVTATRADQLSLELTSDVPGELPLDGSNLALRAAELLRSECDLDLGAALHVHKQVPIAGGMGGGSADAAATLVALDRLWGTGLGPERLRALGARLGADVPFAMLGHTALGRGNGADLTTVLTHGEWTWLLAVPGGHLSTRRCSGVSTRSPSPLDAPSPSVPSSTNGSCRRSAAETSSCSPRPCTTTCRSPPSRFTPGSNRWSRRRSGSAHRPLWSAAPGRRSRCWSRTRPRPARSPPG